MNRQNFSKIQGLGSFSIQTIATCTSNKKPVLSDEEFMRATGNQLVNYAIRQTLHSVLLNTFQPLESLVDKYLTQLNNYAYANEVSILIGIIKTKINCYV